MGVYGMDGIDRSLSVTIHWGISCIDQEIDFYTCQNNVTVNSRGGLYV